MDLDAIRDYVECKIEKMLEGVNLKTSSTYSKTRFEEMDFEDRALEIIKEFSPEMVCGIKYSDVIEIILMNITYLFVIAKLMKINQL